MQVNKIFSYMVLLLIIITFSSEIIIAQSKNQSNSSNLSKIETEDDFMFVGLPDTQHYTESSSLTWIFNAQTEWIAQHYIDSNIVFVAHLGDMVQNGDTKEAEWQRADPVMANIENIDGLNDGIPYGISVGNNDQTPKDDPDESTVLYNDYFGISRFSGRSYYGGHYYSDNNDDYYILFEVGSIKFISVFLEYGAYRDPNGYPLTWADGLLKTYNNRFAIIVSHKILDADGTFNSQGQALFDTLKNNPNLFLMLCGHVPGVSRKIAQNDAGKNVYVLLSDYQSLNNGGDGWMRLMRFSPSDNKIYVSTYSPSLNDLKTDSNNQFTLNYSFDNPFPVELVSFKGIYDGTNVKLNWNTATEVNNYGFEIERSFDNSKWNKIGFVHGNGNSNVPHAYSYFDNDLNLSGTYTYRLKQMDNDGKFQYSNTIQVKITSAGQYVLKQNYPNPFNPITTIEYRIPRDCYISIVVYDILGREIKTLINEFIKSGIHKIDFNASGLASGVYFYRMNAVENNGLIYNETKSFIILD